MLLLIEYLMRLVCNAIARRYITAQERRENKNKSDAKPADEPFVVIGEIIRSLRQKQGKPRLVPIPLETLYRGMLILGKVGSGKTNLLMLILQWAIRQGFGIVCVDFRGENVDRILALLFACLPLQQVIDCLLLFDMRAKSHYGVANEPVVGLNILLALGEDPYAAAALFMDILRQIWGEAAMGIRLKEQLHHAVLALRLSPSGPYSLLDIEPFLLDQTFRSRVLSGITDPAVLRYFDRYDNGKDRESEAEAVLNKLSPLLMVNQRLKATLGADQKEFSFQEFLRKTKAPYILICADSGSLGKQGAGTVCALFLNAILRAVITGDAVPGTGTKTPLFLACDEFINYAAACREPLDEAVREGRKFRLATFLVTQSAGLLDPYTRHLVQNVLGSVAYLSQGGEDANTAASMLSTEVYPKPILRAILQQARPGEAILSQDGCPLQHVQTFKPDPNTVADEDVKALRAAALARRGQPLASPIVASPPPPDPASPPASLQVRDVVEDTPKSARRRKSK